MTKHHMTAPAVSLAETNVKVDSIVFGDIELPESSIVTFADGLHGFEAHKRFALVPAAREGLFWLQSLAHRDIAFLLVDPFVASPGYEVDLGATERLALSLASPDDVLILAIVTMSPDRNQLPTANLRGPIVFNVQTRLGRQVVTANEQHDVKTPVDVLSLPERM